MSGPPKTPTEIKKLRGTARADRTPAALTVVQAVTPTLEPPDTLQDEGAQEWRHILANASWIGPSDLRNLRLLCEAIDRRAHLLAELASQGWVLYTDKGYAYQNPAGGALATTEAQITKWLSLLGLTPSDRGRLGVAEVKAQSALERIRANRAKAV
jgi:P27 family predicted phage terminase small subunit